MKPCFFLIPVLLFLLPQQDPGPLSPQEQLKTFRLPEGFRIELVASEPLIQEPTGLCWDEKGDLYVSELHGYNLEGQLEIEALNKTGVVDTLVRRIQAAEPFKKAAEAGTYGTIKKLVDTNGDGQMDQAVTFADHISPAYGLCAANGGILVAGHAEIVFLKDEDQDGRAEQVDTLYKGFQSGALERGLNAPQWGPDGWIYVGRGWNGGTITGPKLAQAVQLPGSNFRIRADGSAIEPITGSTHTIGHAFTPDGYSFFTNTWKHALYAAPIPWHYLARNPDAVIGSLEADASDYSTVFPIAPVHPWKLARSNQEEWRKYYDRYGLAESAAEGYFTSSCSPMVYQDNLFPAEYWGNLFVCEPAQCLIHRCIIRADGTGLKVSRAPSEQNREFLASTDSWFRPVSMVSAPDGSLYITDMYREIIEDYSAVPRFMQQKYGLKNGVDKGRIWRVSPITAPTLDRLKQTNLRGKNLAKELDSPHYWRRQNAERLIYERMGKSAPALLKREGSLDQLNQHSLPTQFVRTLQKQDTLLRTKTQVAQKLAALSKVIQDERMLLQLALSLGYSQDPQVLQALLQLARERADIRWMTDALLTSIYQKEVEFLSQLLANPGRTGHLLIDPLASTIAARQDAEALNTVLEQLSQHQTNEAVLAALRGLNTYLSPFKLKANGENALKLLLQSSDLALRAQAITLATKLNKIEPKTLEALQQKASLEAADAQLTAEQRLMAVQILADAPDALAGPGLIQAWVNAPPHLRSSIIDALITRGKRLGYLLSAIEAGKVAPQTLLPLQRAQLLEGADAHIRPRLEAVFSTASRADEEAIFNRYALALGSKGEFERGQLLFQQMCSPCHRVGLIGVAVGPDLKNSFANANETILRNILFPSEKIASGYDVYTVVTTENSTHSGILVSESANNIILKQAGGREQTFLRKNIQKLSSSSTSLMPAYAEVLSPDDCANIIAWMKQSLAGKEK